MPSLHARDQVLLSAAAAGAALFWLGLLWLGHTVLERALPQQALAGTLALLIAAPILTHSARRIRQAAARAALLAHAVAVGARQYPELHAGLEAFARRLGLDAPPQLYVGRAGNAPARGLPGRAPTMLAVHADLVDALAGHPGAIEFHLAFALAWQRHPLTRWAVLLAPATVLPLLGPALRRARSHACDRAALAACRSKGDAGLALAALAGGARRWKSLGIAAFAAQADTARDLGAALMELVDGEPWLSRRVARLRALATSAAAPATRPALAYVAAAFVPHIGWGRPGAAARAVLFALWALLIGLGWYGAAAPPPAAAPSGPAAPAAATAAPVPTAAAPTPASEGRTTLDADLQRLGALALERFRRRGGNPCEVGDIATLALNHRAARYAFSCDRPVVYTAVEPGEFEPGRAAYLRTYHWQERRFGEELSRPGAGATP